MKLKICVLVKEVPDAAARRRIDPTTGRLDRTGEKSLNPGDLRAIEAAVQLRERGEAAIEEIVLMTMGPGTSRRTLERALALGADRALHLVDDALSGSDVVGTGYALARVLERESPDLVLLGQKSEDGECYAMAAIVAEHLRMPSLSQVLELELQGTTLRAERNAEFGRETVRMELPAVIAVSDLINEPRYPSLKAIMGAKRKPLEHLSVTDAGIDALLVGEAGARVACGEFHEPPVRSAGAMIKDDGTDATVERILAWLDKRKLI